MDIADQLKKLYTVRANPEGLRVILRVNVVSITILGYYNRSQSYNILDSLYLEYAAEEPTNNIRLSQITFTTHCGIGLAICFLLNSLAA